MAIKQASELVAGDRVKMPNPLRPLGPGWIRTIASILTWAGDRTVVRFEDGGTYLCRPTDLVETVD